MKHIAVTGTGTIGLMLGAFLSRGGHDVTMVPLFRPEVAELLNREGVKVSFGAETFTQPVRAVFAGDLPRDESFNIVFLTGKSNDTEAALDTMVPHLAPDGYVSSLQNGINDYVIASRVGSDRVIPCVCFAGGQCPEKNYVVTHDGSFTIGELSGETTPRLLELEEILSCVKHVDLTDDIMAARWRKLSEVCITVPVATVTGYPLFANFALPEMQRSFGLLACEITAVKRACGVQPEPIMGLTAEEWKAHTEKPDPALEAKFLARTAMPAPAEEDENVPHLAPEDAYTQDIRKGRPLEVWYTNGYVAQLAREHGVETPVLDRLLELLRQIEAGKAHACPENLAILTGRAAD